MHQRALTCKRQLRYLTPQSLPLVDGFAALQPKAADRSTSHDAEWCRVRLAGCRLDHEALPA
jgi:hypothetical protein